MARCLSIYEFLYWLAKHSSNSSLYRRTKFYINKVRGPLWEAHVINHRNIIREAARRKGVQYNADQIAECIPKRVRSKGLNPKRKGDLKIYTAYCSRDWTGDNLSSVFQSFGTVHHFELESEVQNRYDWFRTRRGAMNRRLLDDLSSQHRKHPIDVFFCYGGGFGFQPTTIETINSLGIATLNMGLDDMSGLSKGRVDDVEVGVALIAPYFDMFYTSTLAACEEYLLMGARPYYLPMGANPLVYRRIPLKRDIPLAFFGRRHGVREALVRELEQKGFEIQTYGPGWESGYVGIEKLVELINRTEIVIGHGNHTRYSESSTVRVTCLKARDLEIPMCGALYATTFDPELQFCFGIGEEIICYRTVDDLYDSIRYLLSNPRKMEAIRNAAWCRAHQEHTWEHRFEELFTVMGLLNG